MSYDPFQQDMPPLFRLEFEILHGTQWQKRWVLMLAATLDEAWSAFASSLTERARRAYDAGEIRIVSASPALLLGIEYRQPPEFKTPTASGVPSWCLN